MAGANSGNNVALSFDSAQDKLAQGIKEKEPMTFGSILKAIFWVGAR
ncbi:MAG: hypothetical protein Q8R20_01270 [Nanoarchaeota archaeon]|nr:hypothetical protein [Nanoarchaeota archaeon]